MTSAGTHSAQRIFHLALAGALLLLPEAAMAAKKAKTGGKAPGSPETVSACVDNYKSGLDKETSGHLRQARELFIKCSKAACGSPLREECTTRFTQLSTDIPSIVPMVTDEAGGPQTDVEVRVDGEHLASSLDGHSFPLDPGVREVSFSKDGRVFATQKVMIIQGQRNRLISASMGEGGGAAGAPTKRAAAATAKGMPAKKAAVVAQASDTSEAGEPTPEPVTKKVTPHLAAPEPKQAAEPEVEVTAEDHAPSGTPAMTYVLAGTGVAALAAGGALILWGRKDNSRLTECSVPGTSNCPQAAVDHIHNLYLAGNVALGVGVASLAAAYWVYSRAGKEQSTKEAYHFDLQPNKGGAVAGIAGSF
jgi:hypothetical protein